MRWCMCLLHEILIPTWFAWLAHEFFWLGLCHQRCRLSDSTTDSWMNFFKVHLLVSGRWGSLAFSLAFFGRHGIRGSNTSPIESELPFTHSMAPWLPLFLGGWHDTGLHSLAILVTLTQAWNQVCIFNNDWVGWLSFFSWIDDHKMIQDVHFLWPNQFQELGLPELVPKSMISHHQPHCGPYFVGWHMSQPLYFS